MSQFFTSAGQSTGISASTSVLPKIIQDWSPLWWTGLISLQSKGLSKVFSNTTVQKHQFFGIQLSLQSKSYIHTGKTIALTRRTFAGKVMSLLSNMLSTLVITFLPRSKHLLISWLQSPSAVILEPKKIKSDTVSTVPHLFPMKWWDQMPWSSFSECWALSQLFHSPLSLSLGFPGGSEVKGSASNAGDPGLIPGSGRSPGKGNGNPLQYSWLQNPMDREAW